MAISAHLAGKLKETLGPEAGEDLVTWMGETDSLRGDVAELRHEMETRFTRLEAKLDALGPRFDALLEKRINDLLKWSFVFWCSAVGAIATLAGVLK